jgi:hypothetical protein
VVRFIDTDVLGNGKGVFDQLRGVFGEPDR